MGSKLLSEVKTWALELWQSFNHGELFMPAVGGPEGDPVYDTAAIEHEVSNVRASMSMSTHTVAPSSYTATLATAGLGVDPQHVITATRTEVLNIKISPSVIYYIDEAFQFTKEFTPQYKRFTNLNIPLLLHMCKSMQL